MKLRQGQPQERAHWDGAVAHRSAQLGRNHLRRSERRALVSLNHLERVRTELFAPAGVSEQCGQRGFERGGVRHLQRAVVRDELRGDGTEVFHVWTEDHRLPQRAGLDGILSTCRRQAFADEDDGGVPVEVAQLAGGVYQQAIHSTGSGGMAFRQFRAQREANASGPEFLDDGLGALKVARDQHQEEFGKARSKPEKHLCKQQLFARVSAAGDKELGILRHGQRP